MKQRKQLQFCFDISESQTPCTSPDPQCGNRESSTIPCDLPQVDGTVGEGSKPNASMHVVEQSDEFVVPTKRANNVGGAAPVDSESVEGRGSAKGNDGQPQTIRPQSRKHRSGGLLGVRLAAEKDRKLRFTNLMHHLSLELLTSSFFDLKKNAAPGIDDVKWQDYAQDYKAHLQDLHARVHGGRYRALASKRKWIQKSDGKLRPLALFQHNTVQRWKTRSSKLRSSRCYRKFTRSILLASAMGFVPDAANTTPSMRSPWD